MAEAFRVIDKDSSGSIDEEELFEILKHAPERGETEPFTIEDVKAAMM